MRERGATRRGEHERGDGIIVSFIFDMFVEFAEFLDSTPEIEISVLPVTTHVVNVIAPARRAEGRRSDPVVSGVIPARATFGALPSETIRRSCWDPRDWYNPCKTDGGVHGRPSDPRDVHFSLRPSS